MPDVSAAPRVSVIVPTHNRVHYLVPALDSVLAQTLPGVEIIVVDDGSTDGTEARVREYGDRVRYVRMAHQGAAVARNVGAEAARGEYVAWLDDDDEYRPHKLALQAEVLDTWPEVGFVYTEMSAFDDKGFADEWHLRRYHASAYKGVTYENLFPQRYRLAETPLAPLIGVAGPSQWGDRHLYIGSIFDAYLHGTLVFTNSILFRRGLLARCGPQQPRFGLAHDYEFVLRLSRLAPAAFLDVPTYRLRYHPGQVSTSARPGGKLVTIRKQRDFLRVLKTFVRSNPAYCRAHRAELDRQLGRLHRAVAIPMLAYVPRTPHEARLYRRQARRHLRRAARLGVPDWKALLLSFVPRGVLDVAHRTVLGLRRRRATDVPTP